MYCALSFQLSLFVDSTLQLCLWQYTFNQTQKNEFYFKKKSTDKMFSVVLTNKGIRHMQKRFSKQLKHFNCSLDEFSFQRHFKAAWYQANMEANLSAINVTAINLSRWQSKHVSRALTFYESFVVFHNVGVLQVLPDDVQLTHNIPNALLSIFHALPKSRIHCVDLNTKPWSSYYMLSSSLLGESAPHNLALLFLALLMDH